MKRKVEERKTYRIVTHCLEPRADRREEVVEVRLVLIVKEPLPTLPQPIRLIVRRRLEDIPRLEKDTAHVGVDALEPIAELGVAACIVDEDVDSVEYDVHGRVVGEALEKGTELEGRELELVVLGDGVGVGAGEVLGGGAGVLDVFAEVVEDPGHGLLVVVVLLAFDDDLEE